ncbi:ribosome recycling factor [Bacilli bacterium PM5-3]|nr:ribosome recycling factor [Bacilli bacterium PM5-3]MDH6604081.1 ribosome recycling factor [Bacilli bacterium PM5-9]
MSQIILDNTKDKMNKTIESFENNLVQIRTGRANPAMLDGIEVEYYGAMTPLNQVSAITVPEGRQLLIKPYDKTLVDGIERAINEANLGINPQSDGENVRLNIPPLTEESRKLLVKDVSKYAEDAKVAIRNIRRDANDAIKKDKELTKDDVQGYQDDVQTLTDNMIKKIDEIAKAKETDLMTV